MRFYPTRTVEEQANRLPLELLEAYKNSQLDRITIFDGTTELTVTGYAEYSYLDEKSYKTQPVRTNNGAIQEIEEYATFLTPRLIIKYNMMNIEDYRALMKMFKKQNGFIVKCYDVVEDKIVRNEMYVATPSMPVIYQQYLIALGIQEYGIELIGTNVPINTEKKEEGTHIIPFTLDDISYDTNRGKTWEEWVVDIDGENGWDVVYTSNGYVISPNNGVYTVTLNGEIVRPEDYIFSGAIYRSAIVY